MKQQKKKKVIDIKGEPRCELQEPGLVRAALFDIMLRELGRLGEISGLISTAVCVWGHVTCVHNDLTTAAKNQYTCMHI